VASLSLDGDDIATTRDLIETSARYAKEVNQNSAAGANEMLTEIAFRATLSRQSVSIQLHRRAVRERLLSASEVGQAQLDSDPEQDLITLEMGRRGKGRAPLPRWSAFFRSGSRCTTAASSHPCTWGCAEASRARRACKSSRCFPGEALFRGTCPPSGSPAGQSRLHARQYSQAPRSAHLQSSTHRSAPKW
jgi:hypothetical protein